MSEWKAKIEKVSNGYIVTTPREMLDSDDKIFYEEDKEVFIDENDHTGFINMTWYLMNHFDEVGSKHDKQRCWIGYEKQNGDKVGIDD